MPEGRERFSAALLEMAPYAGVCLATLYRPQAVYLFESEAEAALDVMIGFVISRNDASSQKHHGAAHLVTKNLVKDAKLPAGASAKY